MKCCCRESRFHLVCCLITKNKNKKTTTSVFVIYFKLFCLTFGVDYCSRCVNGFWHFQIMVGKQSAENDVTLDEDVFCVARCWLKCTASFSPFQTNDVPSTPLLFRPVMSYLYLHLSLSHQQCPIYTSPFHTNNVLSTPLPFTPIMSYLNFSFPDQWCPIYDSPFCTSPAVHTNNVLSTPLPFTPIMSYLHLSLSYR